MSHSTSTNFEQIRAAFASRRILDCSAKELRELLVGLGSETLTDPAERARAREMGETMRQLLVLKQRPKASKLAWLAAALSLAALVCSGVQFYQTPRSQSARAEEKTEMNETDIVSPSEGAFEDSRKEASLSELAKRAPTLRTGTVQAWWAGEQARQIQRLEALAKKQTLAGDREGAARSANRADAIRRAIPTLATSEKPLN